VAQNEGITKAIESMVPFQSFLYDILQYSQALVDYEAEASVLFT